ncbi:MAG TPA: prepilin peptidase [Vicinamibacterales bacterium]|nr:prepilin peptidase [Vicinamibacterales bacterium]
MSTLYLFVGAILILACVSDLRTRRIPNVLTFSAIAGAVLYHGVIGGLNAAGWSLAGCLLGAVLFFPIFALRGMGAGDVKLLAAVGAWLGPSQVAIVALASSIAGGAIAIAVALGYGYLRTAVHNLWMLLMDWRVMGIRPLQEMTLEGTRGPRLAYAVPISIGTVVTLWIK